MISVSILKRTQSPVSVTSLKSRLAEFLASQGIQSEAEVSVVIVSRAQMLEYVKTHLKEKGAEAAAHPVLSFVQSEMEGPFKFPPDNILHLGEIIVSYPHAVDDAKKKNITIEDSLYELIEHSALHLLGIHHD